MISAKSNVFSGISSLGSRLPAAAESLPNARSTAVEAAQRPAPTPTSTDDRASAPSPAFFPALIVEPSVVENEEEKTHRKAKAAYQRRLAAREGLDRLPGRSVDENA